MLFPFDNIPHQLSNSSNAEDDINILIGENGSGKSTLLNKIAKRFINFPEHDLYKVIAIANSIYDKFNVRHKQFEILRASVGKSLVKTTIINAFKILANEDFKRIRNIAKTLEYIDFDPIIGIMLNGIDENFRDKIIDSELEAGRKEDMLYFLNRYVDENFSHNNIIKINFYNENFEDLKNSFLITIFLYEKELRKLKLIKSISIFLYKKEQAIPLNGASSGELTVISTLLYLTTTINEHSIILIDEPENSLHPKWQIDYVKLINELFYLYQPKIIIATHSPLIINGAELNSTGIKIFKGSQGFFRLITNESNNVEEIYHDYFNLTTPENRFLSESVTEEMNLLAKRAITISQFDLFIDELKASSYDERQKDVLDGLKEMGRKIIKNQ